MKYHTIIYGCQMNLSDAERVDAIMQQIGYEKTTNINDADAAIVVACSVRQHAIDRIFGLKKKIETIKKVHPCIAILTGCVLESDKKKMKEFFDLIIKIEDLIQLPKKLEGFHRHYGRGVLQYAPTNIGDYLSIHPAYQSDFQAYVPISNGCNQFCSYCVVPFTRGREVYRNPDEIIKECKNLIAKGYKEITLLGQTVNSYNHKKANFTELMRRIDSLAGDFWIRFVSSHPNFFTDEFIELWKNSKHITPNLHLAVQSGDNGILKKMNRKYTVGKFRKIVKKIQKAIPHISLSTDIIVGYPGETEKQFENTVKLMRTMKFDMAYIAKYSPRKGTLGAKLHKDDVSMEKKRERHRILNDILKKTALAKNKKYIGKTVRVLIENQSKGFWIGKADTFKNVKILKTQGIVGSFQNIKITKATAWGLEGKLYE